MSRQTVIDAIKAAYGAAPPQMQQASQYLIGHSSDVALLSMRELSRRAQVPPSTMTRLAKRLGYAGYEELRTDYIEDLTDASDWFSDRAQGMLSRRDEVGEVGLVDDFSATFSGYVRALSESQTRLRLEAAADTLMNAESIFCVGARSAHPVAYIFGYVLNYFLPRIRMLSDPGGADMDALLSVGPADVVFAVSFEPYARSTEEAVSVAVQAGCSVVSITDHEIIGIGRHSDVTILVPKHSPSFFDTMTPAFAAAEILSAMLASRVGPEVAERVRERETRLSRMSVWSNPSGGGARIFQNFIPPNFAKTRNDD